ncbi:MAG: epoxyqueuosine reductase [Thermoplasmata archaeon]|nr:MAG: epoxyqueuosine reductase [Thermoplasmata archaeon]
MNELEEALVNVLTGQGAVMVGFADIADLPAQSRQYMDSALWFAVALDPRIVRDIENGPTKLYEIEYRKKNEILSKLTRQATKVIRSFGFEARPRQPTDEDIDWIDLVTPLPHKTVATRAGVGWIGKCGLLVTEEYGSAIRMAVVLTDASFTWTQPIGYSMCGDCEECVVHCPAGAPTGEDWIKGMEREEYYDAHKCHEHIIDTIKAKGLSAKVCGVCIAVCPYTKKYVKHHLASP